jgi:hypothetical protein
MGHSLCLGPYSSVEPVSVQIWSPHLHGKFLNLFECLRVLFLVCVCVCVCVYECVYEILEIKPRASHMLGKHSTMVPHPQPLEPPKAHSMDALVNFGGVSLGHNLVNGWTALLTILLAAVIL